MTTRLINQFTNNPKKLLLIDAAGALLSAFLLGFVLVKFESFFGIPKNTLFVLATIPIFFALFDVSSFVTNILPIKTYLKSIALFNVGYCFLSLGFAIYHADVITLFGWAYIIAEVLIVLVLAILEFKLSQIQNS